MRIGEVIGKVTLSRCHPSLVGAAYRMVVPLSLAELTGDEEPQAEPFVVFDEFGSGHGSKIAISEGGEAAQPFFPELKPVDAYCSAILDHLNIKK
jgi:microcompartment protein CcmK/EutM